MDGVQAYTDEFIAILKQDIKDETTGKRLYKMLTINPGAVEANMRKKFRYPNDFDLYKVPNKFKPLITLHIKVLAAVHDHKSYFEAFDTLNEICLSLVRACEQQDKWIMPAVIGMYEELLMVYKAKNKRDPEDLDSFIVDDFDDFGSSKKKSDLETIIDTLRRGFNVVFNDKNPDLNQSKKNYIYFFLANLMKYCFKMGKLDFARSISKTVEGNKQYKHQVVSMSHNIATKKNAITYLYYLAIIALDDGDFVSSEARLNEAVTLMHDYNINNRHSKQMQQILLILIPLKLYLHGKLPNDRIKISGSGYGKGIHRKDSDCIWTRFPLLKHVYKDNFFQAIKKGNFSKFDECINTFQIMLLKNHLYVLMELIRQLVQLQLIHKTWEICQGIERNHIISLSAFQISFAFSNFYNEESYNRGSFRMDAFIDNISILEIETIIANLISQGKINAYISNGQKCIVFSKTNPFPGITDKRVAS
ncbi:CSN12 [Candida oxycetoniae]|uniref:CSN12 n=1 Tax=Candida oxycetoniae TaxID=497107 RepID=A0AAI9SV00_9ASCO|nr:CSN12 [Candida oxycetoniae]KAI3403568.2 CSN12 [Candida oxycetoniae]